FWAVNSWLGPMSDIATKTGWRSDASGDLRDSIIWLMPIEATSPQPNAKANNTIDLVRMNASRKSSPRRSQQRAAATRHQPRTATAAVFVVILKEHWPPQAANLTKKRFEMTAVRMT